MTEFFELLFYLAAFHAFGDYALQTDFIYEAKNHRTPKGAERHDFGLPQWPLVLGAHAFIHGGGVAFLTGSILLGCLEIFAHALIDYLKSDGRFGVYTDQALHILSKIIWALAALSAASGPILGA